MADLVDPMKAPRANVLASRSIASADISRTTLFGRVFRMKAWTYTGTLPISRPASLMIAMRRSGSSSGLSSETPMASTVALMTASVSFSANKACRIKKPVDPSVTCKKVTGHLATSSLPSSSRQHCSDGEHGPPQLAAFSEKLRPSRIGFRRPRRRTIPFDAGPSSASPAPGFISSTRKPGNSSARTDAATVARLLSRRLVRPGCRALP